MILLDDTLLISLFGEDKIKLFNQQIQKKVPKINQGHALRDWIKLHVLERYGGVFVDEDILLADKISKI